MMVLNETAEQFECKRCDILYRTKRSLIAIKIGGRFSCIACNAEIHEWRGYHDYAEWRALNWTSWLQIGEQEPSAA